MRALFVIASFLLATVQHAVAQSCSYSVQPSFVNSAAPIGGSVQVPITVTPTGTIDFTFAVQPSDVFSISPRQVTAANKPFQVILTASPRQTITYNPTVTITATLSGSKPATACTGPGSVSGSVNGQPNDFAVSPLTLDFGNVAVGQTSELKVTLTPQNPFNEIDVTLAPGFSVPPGGDRFPLPSQFDVPVRFTPAATGFVNAALRFSAANTGINKAVIVKGTGTSGLIIPHAAFGGGFLSRLFLTNLSGSPNPVILTRMAQDGSVLDTQQQNLDPGATVILSDPDNKRSVPISIFWYRISAAAPVSASVLFDEGNTAVGALTATPVPGFAAPVRSGDGFTAGVAIVNLDANTNNISLNLVGSDGLVKATDNLTLNPSQQTAFVLTDRPAFRNFLSPGGSPVSFTGSLQVASGNATQSIAAMLVGSQDGKLFSIPVAPMPQPATSPLFGSLVPAATYQTVIPHSAFGAGFITRLFVTNLTNAPNTVTVFRLNQSGQLVTTTPATVAPNGTFVIEDPEARRNDPNLNVQWFAIDSTGPVTASVLFDRLQGGDRNPVGALSATPVTKFAVPVRQASGATTGIALVNLSSQPNAVSMQLLDASGAVKASDSLSLQAFNQTAFVITDRAALKAALCPGGACADFAGSLVVTSGSSTQPVAAMVVSTNNNQIFSLPVTQMP